MNRPDPSVAGPRRRRRLAEKDTPKARRIRARKIKRKLKALRKVRARIVELRALQPANYDRLVANWQKRAGRLRRELRELGWKPKKARSTDPLEETQEQAIEETLPEPEPLDAGEPEIVEEELPPEDDGELPDEADLTTTEGECQCHRHPNWLHGDGEQPKVLQKIANAAKRLGQGIWRKPQALGTQGKLLVRPGQEAMVVAVQPGLFIVQFHPSTLGTATAGIGDEVGVLPLLLLPGIAKGVRRAVERVKDPGPGQLGHPTTPPLPRASEPAASPVAPPAEDGTAGPRGRRRRRPGPRRPPGRAREEEASEDEDGDDEAPAVTPARRRRRRGPRGAR